MQLHEKLRGNEAAYPWPHGVKLIESTLKKPQTLINMAFPAAHLSTLICRVVLGFDEENGR